MVDSKCRWATEQALSVRTEVAKVLCVGSRHHARRAFEWKLRGYFAWIVDDTQDIAFDWRFCVQTTTMRGMRFNGKLFSAIGFDAPNVANVTLRCNAYFFFLMFPWVVS